MKKKYRQLSLFNDEVQALGEMLSENEAKALRGKIPLNPLATDEVIKELKGDDPVDCIFTVDYREGSNGVYADSAFESISKQILTADPFIPAGYGHQSKEAFRYEGRQLYGTVIGALLDTDEGKIHYRIIADKGDNAKDVRRWLKNKQLGAVSIWGIPTYNDDNTEIVDYLLRSVDFVPPHSEGQKNKAHIGEMGGVSHEEVDRMLSKALKKKYCDYIFVPEVFDDFFVAEYDGEFFKIPYEIKNNNVDLGTAEKTRRVIKYEPVEVNMGDMTNDALLAEIKARTGDGRLSAENVAGEMGVKLENVEVIKALEEAKLELEKFKETASKLGLTIDEALQVAKDAKEAEKQEKEKEEFEKSVEAVKAEKGLLKDGKATGEMASFVDKFARLEVGMTKEQIAGEMQRVIDDADIQKLVQAKSASKPIADTRAGSEVVPEVITF